MARMFVLRCPKCGHEMRYQPLKEANLSKNIKRCVYCGHSYKVRDHIVKIEK